MVRSAAAIRCPRCINSKMLEQVWRGVPMHICMRCGAIFFRHGDLASWVGTADDIPASADVAADHRPAKVLCPDCSGTMEYVRFGLTPSLEVERCLTCLGVLLDFDEVRRMLEIARWVASRPDGT